MAPIPAMCAFTSAIQKAIGNNSALTSMEKLLAITPDTVFPSLQTAAQSPLVRLATTAMAAVQAMCASISAIQTVIGGNLVLTSMEKPLTIPPDGAYPFRLMALRSLLVRLATTAMAAVQAMYASTNSIL